MVFSESVQQCPRYGLHISFKEAYPQNATKCPRKLFMTSQGEIFPKTLYTISMNSADLFPREVSLKQYMQHPSLSEGWCSKKRVHLRSVVCASPLGSTILFPKGSLDLKRKMGEPTHGSYMFQLQLGEGVRETSSNKCLSLPRAETHIQLCCVGWRLNG